MVADGLDCISKVMANGIGWLATGIFGLPPFLSGVIGKLAAGAALAPLQLRPMANCFRVLDIAFHGENAAASMNSLLESVAKDFIAKDLSGVETGNKFDTVQLTVGVERASEDELIRSPELDLAVNIHLDLGKIPVDTGSIGRIELDESGDFKEIYPEGLDLNPESAPGRVNAN
jgi:hypothetical protein